MVSTFVPKEVSEFEKENEGNWMAVRQIKPLVIMKFDVVLDRERLEREMRPDETVMICEVNAPGCDRIELAGVITDIFR
ncbi:hypothetical protein BLNAU_24931 [Blattamonas nauphoetae]|uniref:Uncharacterized protein n=1 Tax=Blattamonas nauphoetae TaxID=2049346 RepID=A0ABQ9WL17_9EUKA|nr:hypothetical protein BLNAU_24931 [Blattamonas nauphoetae]